MIKLCLQKIYNMKTKLLLLFIILSNLAFSQNSNSVNKVIIPQTVKFAEKEIKWFWK